MLPGLVSITFRKLQPEEIIELAAKAHLKGIEWGGDVHIPHGDKKQARKIGQMTIDSGLACAAYGSYYRIAESEQQGLKFDTVLSTALELRTKLIRVWAGAKESQSADERYWRQIVDESRRIGDIAAKENIEIVYEFHYNTLTDTYESCRKLLEDVNHPNIFTYWQPRYRQNAIIESQGIEQIIKWIKGVHVFYWTGTTSPQRHLLRAGIEDWKLYFEKLKKVKYPVYALLEFAKDDEIDNFVDDTGTLTRLLQ